VNACAACVGAFFVVEDDRHGYGENCCGYSINDSEGLVSLLKNSK